MPQKRLGQRVADLRKNRRLVIRYSLRLLPELYAHLNLMSHEAAAQMEKDLAGNLCRAGYTVTGEH
jgi:hypothetical protein